MDSNPGLPMDQPAPRRYEILFKLAAGGMATVYVGYLRGGLGFRQVVAIKRPHPHLLGDPAFRQSFVAEANLACRIHHANVVDVRDVDVSADSIDLVMDYVEGASLSKLLDAAMRNLRPVPPSVAIRIALDSCAGLHAAHEATDELGQPLHLVHRDVSPQNILVGMDGVSRVTDFGIAKSVTGGGVTTQQGTLKGKLAYMSPEYLLMKKIDRRADVFAMGAILWESLMGQRLFVGVNEPATIMRVLNEPAPPLTGLPPEVGRWLEPVLARCLAKDPMYRYASALELATAIEEAAHGIGLRPNHREVAAFLGEVVGNELDVRRAKLRDRLANRSTAFPSDSSERRAPAEPQAGSAGSRSGSHPRPSDAASAIQGSALSVAHPRTKASRWWLAPVILGLLGALGASAFAIQRLAFPHRASSAPVSQASTTVPALAPEPAAGPSASLSSPASATAPAPASATAPAPASATAPAPVSATASPPAPTRTAPRGTPPPAITPKGPPPNPY